MDAMTLTEKIIARAAGRELVSPGEEVWAVADRMIMNDSSGPRRIAGLIDELGGVRNPERIVLASDHFVPAANVRHAEIAKTTREWAAAQSLSNFFEYQGVLHNLILQEWLVLPGMLLVGADSHSVTAGAVGAVAVAVGSTELATVLATGDIWLRVPESLRIELEGELPRWLDIRDITMYLLGELHADFALYKAVEFGGSFVESLLMEDRLVLSNQGIEMGSKNAIVEPTARLLNSIPENLQPNTGDVPYPDSGAVYEATHQIDVGTLAPKVALPDAVDHVVEASDVGETGLDVAWIGSCVGGRYEDLRAAAEVLKDRKVTIPLLVNPATHQNYRRAAEDGTMQTLLDAGAIFQQAGCGACAGLHSGVLAAGEKVITTATRNFRGRMGSRESSVFLASPYTVAASAAAGRVIDPREFMADAE